MHAAPPVRRLAVLLAPALLAACASAPSVANSVLVPAHQTRTLHVRAESPREMRLHLWSRGPGTVLFTPKAPLPIEAGASALVPRSGDFVWQVTATTLSIELTGGDTDATVGYELHANGRVTVDVELGAARDAANTAPR